MPKMRISLCRNFGASKGIVAGVVLVEPTFDAIATVAVNKLNIKGKQNTKRLRLFLRERIGPLPAGTELLREHDCAEIFSAVVPGKEVVLSVSIGEAWFAREGGIAREAVIIDWTSLPPLPRWPARSTIARSTIAGAGAQNTNDEADASKTTFAHVDKIPIKTAEVPLAMQPHVHASAASTSRHIATSTSQPSRATPSDNCTFCGAFPVLKGNVLPLILEAIAGCPAFVKVDFGDYIAVDYRADRGGAAASAELFPALAGARTSSRERWLHAVRRECRGLLVCARTGQVLARRFHKFFNVGEVPETHAELLAPLTPDAIHLLAKLDGSLVSPLLLPAHLPHPHVPTAAHGSAPEPAEGAPQRVAWATRRCLSPAVEEFARRGGGGGGTGYDALAEEWLARGWTPLFEWCEAAHPAGVVRHAANSLTLLAIRNNRTGAYLPRKEVLRAAGAHRVPVVQETPLEEVVEVGAMANAMVSAGNEAGDEAANVDVRHIQRAVEKWVGSEGVVLVMAGGGRGAGHQTMYKLKSSWWLATAAAAKQSGVRRQHFLPTLLRMRPTLDGAPLEALWSACLDPGADDILAACCTALRRHSEGDEDARGKGSEAAGKTEEEAERLATFAEAAAALVTDMTNRIEQWGRAARQAAAGNSQAPAHRAALRAALQEAGWSAQVATALTTAEGDRADAAVWQQVRKAAQSRAGASALEQLLWLRWSSWRGAAQLPCGLPPRPFPLPAALEVDRQSARKGGAGRERVWLTPLDPGDGVLTPAPAVVAEHVISHYLPRKIGVWCGGGACPAPSTSVTVPPTHNPAEGKIKGMWEAFANGRDRVVDLRIDLQPCCRPGVAHDDHLGDTSYALWMVQFGASRVCARSSRPLAGGDAGAGAFAAVLMRTGVQFTLSEMSEAMAASLRLKCFVRMDLRHSAGGGREATPMATSSARGVDVEQMQEGEVAATRGEHSTKGKLDSPVASSTERGGSTPTGPQITSTDDVEKHGRCPTLAPAEGLVAEPREGAVDQEGGLSAVGSDPCNAAPGSIPTEPGRKQWRVYCDLDGVLADFDGGYRQLPGAAPEGSGGRRRGAALKGVWKLVASKSDFFLRLPWTADGGTLWGFLRRHFAAPPGKLSILTGLPAGSLGKTARRQKLRWCRRELGDGVQVITCRSSDKHAHAGAGAVLVDDNEELRAAWEAAGGVFIHHASAATSVAALRRLLASAPPPQTPPILREDSPMLRRACGGPAAVPPYGAAFQVPAGCITLVDVGEAAQPQITPGETALCEALRRVLEAAQAAGAPQREPGSPTPTPRSRALAMDVEWQPDEEHGRRGGRKNPAALLQLAVWRAPEAELGDPASSMDVFLVHFPPAGSRSGELRGELLGALLAALRHPHVLKLGYAPEDDVHRLGAQLRRNLVVEGMLDLQAMCHAAFQGGAGDLPSLHLTSWCALGLTLPKDKNLQVSDWAQRPLSAAQRAYAAADAAVLLALHAALLEGALLEGAQAPLLEEGKADGGPAAAVGWAGSTGATAASARTRLTMKGANGELLAHGDDDDDDDASRTEDGEVEEQTDPEEDLLRGDSVDDPAPSGRVLYTAVVLEEESCAALLQRFPRVHRTPPGPLHVTLAHAPDCAHLQRTLPRLGERCAVRVLGECQDARCQVLRVRLPPGLASLAASPSPPAHITMSTAEGTAPSYAGELVAASPLAEVVEVVEAWGLVTAATAGWRSAADDPGGVVSGLAASGIPEKAAQQIEDFAQRAQLGEKLSLRQYQLDARQRFVIHEYCAQWGVESRSEGRKGRGALDTRHLMLAIRSRRKLSAAACRGSGGDGKELRIVAHSRELEDGFRAPARGGGQRLPQSAMCHDGGDGPKPPIVEMVTQARRLAALLGMARPANAETEMPAPPRGIAVGADVDRGEPTCVALSEAMRRLSRRISACVPPCTVWGDLCAALRSEAEEEEAEEADPGRSEDESQDQAGRGCHDSAWDDGSMCREGPAERHVESCCSEESNSAVDDDADGIASGTRGAVLVLRGLPGSGKSHAARRLQAALQRAERPAVAVVCSADEFFERGGGRSRKEVRAWTAGKVGEATSLYSLCFDPGRLQEAHDYCRRAFMEGVEAGARLIIVDNTNSRLGEYAFYCRHARRCGYDVGVLQLECPSERDAVQCHARGTHGVPVAVAQAMWTRWEEDPSAVRLRALHLGGGSEAPEEQGCSDSFPERTASSGSTPLHEAPHGPAAGARAQTSEKLEDTVPPLPSLQQWLRPYRSSRRGQKISHLQMRVGSEAHVSMWVPPLSRAQFMRVYAADRGPKYLCELHDGSFRLFMDIDLVCTQPLEGEWLLWLMQRLQAVVVSKHSAAASACRVIATTTAPEDISVDNKDRRIKSGVHLHMPDVIVDSSQAIEIRESLIFCLSSDKNACGSGKSSCDGAQEACAPPKVNWETAIDGAVYRPGCGLRMMGSLKTKKGMVLGRPYKITDVLDSNGGALCGSSLQAYTTDVVHCLTEVSIHP
ncbi:hypothetical protein CYMTET_31191 [Cymbomonas tetramitiformis]|uniref:R3H domain-containing protein n=1 Tax=Cymbomonas tetramitiformis TaxID=36881 RepID=A0AAE0FHA4_9CHLO|nr:hypothetical protein CYMTET_31191 [Cymbomonas tetramitiformis]